MPMNHGFVTVLPQTFTGASGQMDVKMLLQPNGPVVWEVAVCVAADVVFAKVQIDGCKVSRPDVPVKGFVPIKDWKFSCQGISVVMTLMVNELNLLVQIIFVSDTCKNHRSAGWPAALLTLSRQQD